MQIRSLGSLKPTELMKETIYIKTNRLGFIPQIHMQGPIITPIPITREAAKSMIVAGIELFEVYKDKSGKKQVRLLTLQNVYPGEGERPEESKHDEDGEQKPQVPTSGVAQQEPVQPVNFKGVSVPDEKPEKDAPNKPEKTEKPVDSKDVTVPEEKPEETKLDAADKAEDHSATEKAENSKDQPQNNTSKGGKRNKNKNK